MPGIYHKSGSHQSSDKNVNATACLILFQGKYRNWAKGANFESKLPGNVKKRKEAAEHVTRTLDRDLTEKKISERLAPYTDKVFHRAAIEWLVATDQVSCCTTLI